MILISELKKLIKQQGLSQKEVANKLGIAESTFYRKLKQGIFNSNEIEAMIELLQIEHPEFLFFAPFVT